MAIDSKILDGKKIKVTRKDGSAFTGTIHKKENDSDGYTVVDAFGVVLDVPSHLVPKIKPSKKIEVPFTYDTRDGPEIDR